jgi:hypothetical protein
MVRDLSATSFAVRPMSICANPARPTWSAMAKIFCRAAKIAAYMRVPRTTVIRRLDRLQRWGLIDRRGRHYYMHEKKLNSLIGMKLTIMALREALHTAAPGACKAFVQKITLDQ